MNHLIWVGGGGVSYRISNDPGIESAIPDFIIRTESAKNDLFSKFRLHSLYVVLSCFSFSSALFLLTLIIWFVLFLGHCPEPFQIIL